MTAPGVSVSSAHDEPYRLMSVDPVRAPEGCTGGDWFIYRISRARNAITGYRRGTLEGVNAEVATIVSALNGRREWTKTKPIANRRRRKAVAAPHQTVDERDPQLTS